MSLELILIGIAVLIGAVLIFKLVKKILFAIISFSFFLLIVVVAVGGFVFYDITTLMHQNNPTLNIDIVEDEQSKYSFSLIYTEHGIDINSISNFKTDLEENYYDITIQNTRFKELVNETQVDFSNVTIASLNEFDFSVEGYKLLQILNETQENRLDSFIDELFDSISLPEDMKDDARQQQYNTLEEELEDKEITIDDLIVALLLKSVMEDTAHYIPLIEMYKDESIQIEPSRFSLQVISVIPNWMIPGIDTPNNE